MITQAAIENQVVNLGVMIAQWLAQIRANNSKNDKG